MHPRQQLPTHLAELARSRARALTRAGAIAAGVSRHALTRLSRDWHRLARGLYVVDRTPTWYSHLWGGLLLGGDGSSAAGLSAAALFGVVEPSLPVHVMVPASATVCSLPWVMFHRNATERRRVLPGRVPPRTSLEDAILDAADCASATEVIALISRAFQERRTTVDRLAAALSARRRARHRRLIELCLGIGRDAESALEHLYITRVERPHGLPAPVRQAVIGETGARVDGLFGVQRRILELDGVRYHDRDADQARDKEHGRFGYATTRLGWRAVYVDSCETAELMAHTLALPGLPRRCRKCRDKQSSSAA